MCYLSRLEHIAHNKAKNQNSQIQNKTKINTVNINFCLKSIMMLNCELKIKTICRYMHTHVYTHTHTHTHRDMHTNKHTHTHKTTTTTTKTHHTNTYTHTHTHTHTHRAGFLIAHAYIH